MTTPAPRPYVDRRVVDLDAAHRVAVAATSSWGLPTPDLMRCGMNAIYACGTHVVRVGRATAPAAASHALAATMLEHGIPVARPLPGAVTDADGFAVSGWERLEPNGAAIDWSSVGSSVAQIHRLSRVDLPADYPCPAPTSFPWWDFDELLAAVADYIDESALTGLQSMIERGRSWREAIALDPVVCHGDVHPGNVVMTDRGAVLIDFDLLCAATPAWDHAMLTTYADRWGGAPSVYGAFATGYGRSFAGDDMTHMLGSLRNVAATLMRVRAGITDESARSEAERRLRFWRGDPDAPQWRAQ